MPLMNSAFFKIIMLLFFLFSSYLIFSKLKLKKFFPIFFIAILSVFLFFFSPLTKGNSPDPTPEMKEQILLEQINVSTWYTGYKKDINQMDLNWQQYHKNMNAFYNDEISIETLSMRLFELEKSTNLYKQKYTDFLPPTDLRTDTEATITQIITKTKNYATQQDTVIKKSLELISSTNQKTNTHQQIVQSLEKIMILNSPTTLDISTEISQIKSSLTIPGDK